MKTFELTPYEIEVLKAHYESLAKKWADYEAQQRYCATLPPPSATFFPGGRCFISGLCEGEPQTPENWLRRAEEYRKLKEHHLFRAKSFTQTTKET